MHTFHSNSFNGLHVKVTCHCCKVNGAGNFHWSWADFGNSLSFLFSQAMWSFLKQSGLILLRNAVLDAHMHVKAGMFTFQVIEMHERINMHFLSI